LPEYFFFEFVVAKDQNEVSGHWYNERPFKKWLDSAMVRWLTDTYLRMLVWEPAEFAAPDADDASNVVVLNEPK
jgi:hypothetical protein